MPCVICRHFKAHSFIYILITLFLEHIFIVKLHNLPQMSSKHPNKTRLVTMTIHMGVLKVTIDNFQNVCLHIMTDSQVISKIFFVLLYTEVFSSFLLSKVYLYRSLPLPHLVNALQAKEGCNRLHYLQWMQPSQEPQILDSSILVQD